MYIELKMDRDILQYMVPPREQLFLNNMDVKIYSSLFNFLPKGPFY